MVPCRGSSDKELMAWKNICNVLYNLKGCLENLFEIHQLRVYLEIKSDLKISLLLIYFLSSMQHALLRCLNNSYLSVQVTEICNFFYSYSACPIYHRKKILTPNDSPIDTKILSR